MLPADQSNWVPGLDVSGFVEAIGAGVDAWKIGDRVLCHGDMLKPHGGFAEYTIQKATALVPHPNVPAHVAAATPCAGWTAWRALFHKLNAPQHHSILITGASGGVGGFAVQLARYLDYQTIIATYSAKNTEYVKALGATHVLDYAAADIVQQVNTITGQEGVAIGLDTVGAVNDVLVANSLRYEGQMVGIVNTLTPIQYDRAFAKGLSFHQLSLGSGHRFGDRGRTDLTKAGRAFSQLLEQGQVTVPQLRTVELDSVTGALTDILRQRTVGKIVLRFS